MVDNNDPLHNDDLDIDFDIDDIDIENFVMDGLKNLDKSAPMEYIYYLVGDRPLRIGYIALGVPVIAEIFDHETKKFIIDNFYISYAAESTEIIELDEQTFINECLKRGVKPPEKK